MRRTCGSKCACNHYFLQTGYRIFSRIGNEDALARCEPARFEYDLMPAFPNVVNRLVDLRGSEDAKGCSGDGKQMDGLVESAEDTFAEKRLHSVY